MKGGVTSGVVYPYAILELAAHYRFRSIGGASAGAIAAAFAAAGEYARQAGDPEAFERFRSRCEEIPHVLGGLFQPEPVFERVMAAALAATGEKKGRVGRVARAMAAPLLSGAGAGLLAFGLLALVPLAFVWSAGGAVLAMLGAILSAIFGAAIVLFLHLRKIIRTDLPMHDYGFCSGLSDGSGGPALTNWIHESLQFIAFGKAGRMQPLTFRDLAEIGLSPAEIDAGRKSIDLRMMTTNLSLGRPHAIPDFGLDLIFDPAEWRRLFPAEVMRYLEDGAVFNPSDRPKGCRDIPKNGDLPVVVGVRMSLSFPLLIQAVPMHLIDVGAAARGELPKGEAAPTRRLLFSDGGISSNFPIHFFDALLPTRPTFALSLDDMHAPGLERISMPQKADDGVFSPVREFSGAGGFCKAVLGAAKDWQDEMLSVMPGQRQRVVRIRLEQDEGSLNLGMSAEKSKLLMSYGGEAGRRICRDFDFEEHRYRRTLVAYEHIEGLTTGFARVWPAYGAWYAGYAPQAKSYKTNVGPPARVAIGTHLGAFVGASAAFAPLPGNVRFPKPTGRLAIVPRV
jgi:predicted acylesterase/phospholipase RssA